MCAKQACGARPGNMLRAALWLPRALHGLILSTEASLSRPPAPQLASRLGASESIVLHAAEE